MADSKHKIIAKNQYRVRSIKERFEDEKKPGDHRTDLEKILTTTSLNKFSGNRLCEFTNKLIKELPFSEEVVELTDKTFTAIDGGGRLVLRIGKNSKTFYPIPAIGKKRKTGKMLGKFIVKESNHYVSSGPNKEADITTARKRFIEYIIFANAHSSEQQKNGNMTIRFYLESGRYQEDRDKYKTKTGKYKPVTDNTIKIILSGFDRWMDCKLNEVNKSWALEFDKDCDKKRINKQNNKEFKGLKTNSKRKLFSAFSAMFSICVNAGYIAKNELEGEISRFPKNTKEGKPNTYKMSYESLMDHIFDEDTPLSLTGKLIVSGMAVTAARNSELFKNYIDNFDFENRSIFIPAHISKNGDAGERTVYPASDIWWEKLAFHLKTIDRNEKGHMFPSPIIPEQHMSASMYKQTWSSVKKRFKLKDNARLYDLRSTLLTRVAKEDGIDVAADMAGDSIETANRYYNEKSEERLKEAMRKATGSKNKEDQVKQPNSEAIVLASTEGMPDDVIKIFDIFKNGKIVPQENYLLKSDWDKFVKLIIAQKGAGMLAEGPDLDLWLMVQ